MRCGRDAAAAMAQRTRRCTLAGARRPWPAMARSHGDRAARRSAAHGSPRHVADGGGARSAAIAARSAPRCSTTRQYPSLQCGQHSTAMAATRRMKSCASSRAGVGRGHRQRLARRGQALGLGHRRQQPVVANALESRRRRAQPCGYLAGVDVGFAQERFTEAAVAPPAAAAAWPAAQPAPAPRPRRRSLAPGRQAHRPPSRRAWARRSGRRRRRW